MAACWPGFGEFGGLGQHAVVGVVFVERSGEGGLQDDRDVLGAQELFHFVSFGAAGEDHF